MCDFSLNFVASRPAKVGDKLVSTGFANSTTHGFAAVGEPEVAVCLLPGTELAFEKAVECKRGLGLLRNLVIDETVALFRQVDKDNPNVHHDALEFLGGKIVLLHTLAEGQHVTILQLPATTRGAPAASEAKAQKV